MGERNDTRHISDLNALLEVSRQLASTAEIMPLLGSIENAALRVLDCERASVFLYDAETNELFSLIATGTEGLRFPADRGIAGRTARNFRTSNVPDAAEDEDFNPDMDRQTGYRTQSVLSLPMSGLQGQMIGVLQALNKRDGSFSTRDEELAETLCAQAGVALQRQLLLDEYAEKRFLERDLDIARDIQQALLPEQSPTPEGFDIAGWNRPADRTGGDYFDFLDVGQDRIGLTVADATGHGIGPALVAAECRALMRSVALLSRERDREPALESILAKVNNLLFDDLPPERFVTQFFGILEPKRRVMRYASAGQAPLLYFDADKEAVIELPSTGLPLGMLPGSTYELGPAVTFDRGDILAVLTDGFFEWARDDGEMFGAERLSKALVTHRDVSSEELIARLHDEVCTFCCGTPQVDDLTAVIVKRQLL